MEGRERAGSEGSESVSRVESENTVGKIDKASSHDTMRGSNSAGGYFNGPVHLGEAGAT